MKSALLVLAAALLAGCSVLDAIGPGVPACAAAKDTVPVIGRNASGARDTLAIAIYQKGCTKGKP